MSDVGHPHVTPRRSAAATDPTTVKLGKGRFTTSPSIPRTHDIRHLAAVKQLACVCLVIDSCTINGLPLILEHFLCVLYVLCC